MQTLQSLITFNQAIYYCPIPPQPLEAIRSSKTSQTKLCNVSYIRKSEPSDKVIFHNQMYHVIDNNTKYVATFATQSAANAAVDVAGDDLQIAHQHLESMFARQ